MKQSLASAYALKRKSQKPSLSADLTDDYADDSVDRIMRKRMADGGVVADEGEDDLDKMADGQVNDFDYLSVHGSPDAHVPEDFNTQGESVDNDDDQVMRIMRKRAMKQRNPNPA